MPGKSSRANTPRKEEVEAEAEGSPSAAPDVFQIGAAVVEQSTALADLQKRLEETREETRLFQETERKERIRYEDAMTEKVEANANELKGSVQSIHAMFGQLSQQLSQQIAAISRQGAPPAPTPVPGSAEFATPGAAFESPGSGAPTPHIDTGQAAPPAPAAAASKGTYKPTAAPTDQTQRPHTPPKAPTDSVNASLDALVELDSEGGGGDDSDDSDDDDDGAGDPSGGGPQEDARLSSISLGALHALLASPSLEFLEGTTDGRVYRAITDGVDGDQRRQYLAEALLNAAQSDASRGLDINDSEKTSWPNGARLHKPSKISGFLENGLEHLDKQIRSEVAAGGTHPSNYDQLIELLRGEYTYVTDAGPLGEFISAHRDLAYSILQDANRPRRNGNGDPPFDAGDALPSPSARRTTRSRGQSRGSKAHRNSSTSGPTGPGVKDTTKERSSAPPRGTTESSGHRKWAVGPVETFAQKVRASQRESLSHAPIMPKDESECLTKWTREIDPVEIDHHKENMPAFELHTRAFSRSRLSDDDRYRLGGQIGTYGFQPGKDTLSSINSLRLELRKHFPAVVVDIGDPNSHKKLSKIRDELISLCHTLGLQSLAKLFPLRNNLPKYNFTAHVKSLGNADYTIWLANVQWTIIKQIIVMEKNGVTTAMFARMRRWAKEDGHGNNLNGTAAWYGLVANVYNTAAPLIPQYRQSLERTRVRVGIEFHHDFTIWSGRLEDYERLRGRPVHIFEKVRTFKDSLTNTHGDLYGELQRKFEFLKHMELVNNGTQANKIDLASDYRIVNTGDGDAMMELSHRDVNYAKLEEEAEANFKQYFDELIHTLETHSDDMQHQRFNRDNPFGTPRRDPQERHERRRERPTKRREAPRRRVAFPSNTRGFGKALQAKGMSRESAVSACKLLAEHHDAFTLLHGTNNPPHRRPKVKGRPNLPPARGGNSPGARGLPSKPDFKYTLDMGAKLAKRHAGCAAMVADLVEQAKLNNVLRAAAAVFEDRPCFGFMMNGHCEWGDLCKYNHDMTRFDQKDYTEQLQRAGYTAQAKLQRKVSRRAYAAARQSFEQKSLPSDEDRSSSDSEMPSLESEHTSDEDSVDSNDDTDEESSEAEEAPADKGVKSARAARAIDVLIGDSLPEDIETIGIGEAIEDILSADSAAESDKMEPRVSACKCCAKGGSPFHLTK